MGYFKRTEMYCFVLLEARSLKSGCLQGHALSETCRGGFFLDFSWLLVVSVNPVPWLAAASLQSLPLLSHWQSSLFVSALFLKGHQSLQTKGPP